jgi:hypothetical protein
MEVEDMPDVISVSETMREVGRKIDDVVDSVAAGELVCVDEAFDV